MKIVEVENAPRCPHCKEELDEIWKRSKGWFIEQHTIYFCPHCLGVLSIGYNRGY